MNDSQKDALNADLDKLEKKMHAAEKPHTLEEQIADMKRRGIDPHKSYKIWEEDDDWGNDTWKENGKWKPKTPKDIK